MKILALALMISAASFAAEAKKSLYDYYLEIPSDLLSLRAPSDGHVLSTEEKKKQVAVRDDKNGYLELKMDGIEAAESNPVLALFLRKGKSPLVAMTAEFGDSSSLRFFTAEKNVWVDVSEQVKPKIDDAVLEAATRKLAPKAPKDKKFTDWAGAIVKYKLPRKGTTIEAISTYEDPALAGKKLFDLKYDGDKFAIQ